MMKMDRAVYVAAMLLLIGQAINGGLWAAKPIDGLTALLQTAAENGLPVDGVVLEGWLPLDDERALVSLAALVGADDLAHGAVVKPDEETTVRLAVHEQDELAVTVQVVTRDWQQGQQYYQALQHFADRWAGGKPIGVTVLSQVEEQLDAQACRHLTEALGRRLAAQPVGPALEADCQSYAMWSPKISRSLTVAGEAVNFNVAYACREDSTAVYLGTPVIYQTY